MTELEKHLPSCRSDSSEEKTFGYFEQVVPVKVHHFYIYDAVGAPERYIEMVHRIRTAGPGEHIYIYLNTPGGRLDSTIQIVNAMRSTQAKITTVVEAEAHSAGTMLFLSADEFVINDNCYMLFHNFSGGAVGKGNEIKAQVEATDSWFRKLVHDVYRFFMTGDEIERMLKGEDFWFDSAEVRRRLEVMVDCLQREANGEDPLAPKKATRQLNKKQNKSS